MSEALSELSVSLWRGAEDGRYQTYAVPRRDNQTVLDVVHLRAAPYRPDAVLSLCLPGRRLRLLRHGPSTVSPRWTCRTHVSKVVGKGAGSAQLEIGPLKNLPVIKDLATDMAVFFASGRTPRACSRRRRRGTTPSNRSGPKVRRGAPSMPAIECINCGVLRRLRYRAVEFGLSGAGGADARVHAGE